MHQVLYSCFGDWTDCYSVGLCATFYSSKRANLCAFCACVGVDVSFSFHTERPSTTIANEQVCSHTVAVPVPRIPIVVISAWLMFPSIERELVHRY